MKKKEETDMIKNVIEKPAEEAAAAAPAGSAEGPHRTK